MRTLPALATGLLIFFAAAADSWAEAWQANYAAALSEAARQNKLVLLDFTGSDWCSACMKLSKDTFSKPEFKKFAGQKLVLVELDYPLNAPQSGAIKKQNEALAKKYGIEGYPTLILLNPKGKEIARNVGYLPGGPQQFIKWVDGASR